MTRVSACAPGLPACGQRALGRAGGPARPPRLLPADTPATWAAAGTVDANCALSPARRSASAAPGSALRNLFRALDSERNNRLRCQRAACLPSQALVLSFRKGCP